MSVPNEVPQSVLICCRDRRTATAFNQLKIISNINAVFVGFSHIMAYSLLNNTVYTFYLSSSLFSLDVVCKVDCIILILVEPAIIEYKRKLSFSIAF